MTSTQMSSRASSSHLSASLPAYSRVRIAAAAGRVPATRGAVQVARSYNVDVESERTRAPDSGPRWGGAPPPPPPPPPLNKQSMQPPSRRELLFGFLGAGLGVLGSTAYYNKPMNEAELEEKLTAVLDDLLDDEDLLRLVGEEILFNENLEAQKGSVEALQRLKELDDGLTALQQEIEAGQK